MHDPEDEGLSVREGGGVVPYTEQREQEGKPERRPRDAEHDGAAHGWILRSTTANVPQNKRDANCGNQVDVRLDPAGHVP